VDGEFEQLDALFDELDHLPTPGPPTAHLRLGHDPSTDPGDPRSPNRTLQVLEVLREALGDEQLRDSLVSRGMGPENANAWLVVLSRRRDAMG
jgi:hypothetical protein